VRVRAVHAARARIFGAAIAVLASAAAAAAPIDAYPGAATSYLLVADGVPLWAHAPDLPRPPASLAKLMTALVLLDGDWQPQAPVRASARAVAVDGTRLGLRAGESLRAADALVALLVRSANDVCVALAEHAAGSLEDFAARMNARARQMGLADSHFVHPCGLDAPGQHTTANDLLKIAQAALERPEIAAIVRLPTARVTTLGGRTLGMHNGNHLLGNVEGVFGMKSGYTTGAGTCIVAVAERQGHRVWLVMLDAPLRWWNAAGMIDAAFRWIAFYPVRAPT
jgi:serine-type D-Ala-D-Ala carboxypeptidase (penicillin-binding protein 5/6)